LLSFKISKVLLFLIWAMHYFSWYGSFWNADTLKGFYEIFFVSICRAQDVCSHIIIVISSETLAQISHKRRRNSAHITCGCHTRKKCPQEPSAPVPQYKATKITDFVCTFLDGRCSVIISLICEASECVNKKCAPWPINIKLINVFNQVRYTS
jgi:hypothetical protein